MVWRGAILPALVQVGLFLKCAKEPLLTAAFCVLPLGLVAISNYLNAFQATGDPTVANKIALTPYLAATIENGQLLLFSFSMLGTLLWLSGIDVGGRKFPVRWLFISLIALVGATCIALFAMNTDQKNLMPAWMIDFSIWSYVGFVFAHVLLIRITTSDADLGGSFDRGADALISGLTPGAGK
jgi:hypothetical protein